MPLSERARIEVYLPDLPSPVYQELLEALEQEFTYTFGGCTLARGLSGNWNGMTKTFTLDALNEYASE